MAEPSEALDAPPTIRVALVEDDERLANLTQRYLTSHGVEVHWCSDGRQAVAEISRLSPDVVLLDLSLGPVDGMAICRRLRAAAMTTPIIIITARGEEADKVLGLETGADDYVPKPFSPRELLARIRSQARRRRDLQRTEGERLEVGALRIDLRARRARLAGRTLDLTTYEFDLLRVFCEQPDRVFSRDQLMELVRGSAEESFDRSIDVHISHLRQKLGDDPRQPRLLRTVRGIGYLLAGPEP